MLTFLFFENDVKYSKQLKEKKTITVISLKVLYSYEWICKFKRNEMCKAQLYT